MGNPEQQFGAFVLVERLSVDAPEVFRAHRLLEADVSGPLRLVRFGPDAAPDTLRTLVRAARWAERCQHPGVVRTLEIGRLGASLYAVSELADGLNLERVLIETAVRGISLPFGFVVGIGQQLAALAGQLHHSLEHDAPLLLEYLRPGDVTVTWDGRVRVRPSGGMERGARGHDVYRAPELELGMPVTEVIDVWVIGRLLRTLLTGEGAGRPRTGTGRGALVQDLLARMLARDPRERPDVGTVEARLAEALAEARIGPARGALSSFLTSALADLRGDRAAHPLLVPGALIDARERAAAGPASDLYYPGGGALDIRDLDGVDEDDADDDQTDLVTRPSRTDIQALLAEVARPSEHPPIDAADEPDTSSGEPAIPADEGGIDLDAIASSYVEQQAPPRTPRAGAGHFSPSDTVVMNVPARVRPSGPDPRATDIVERPAALVAAAPADDEGDIFASSDEARATAGSSPPASAATLVGRRPTRSDEDALGPLDALPLAGVERTATTDAIAGVLDELASFEEEPTPTRSVVPVVAPERTAGADAADGVFTAARDVVPSDMEGTAVMRPRGASASTPFHAPRLAASVGEGTELLPAPRGLGSLARADTGVFETGASDPTHVVGKVAPAPGSNRGPGEPGRASRVSATGGAFASDAPADDELADDDEVTIQLDQELAREALALALGRVSSSSPADPSLERTSLVSADAQRGPPALREAPSPEETALLPATPLGHAADRGDPASETGEIVHAEVGTTGVRERQPGAPEAAPPLDVNEEQLGVLVVEVPADAVVFVNGVEQGRGRVLVPDLNRYVAYQVRVHRRRHHPWTASVSLKGQPAARIVPDLVPR